MRAFKIMTALACLGAAGCMPEYKFIDEAAGAATPQDATSADSTATDAADTAVATDSGGGCKSANDCAGKLGTPLCSPFTGNCVECVTSDQCAFRQWCKDEACVPGCRYDAECAPDATGDAGADASSDGSVVTVLKCDTALHVCRGCKIDDECPASFVCASDGTCQPGCTPTHACATGLDCCGTTCVDTKKSLANCGGCGNACPTVAHSTMKCEAGACKVASCDTNWATCNAGTGADSDGCETDLLATNDHCGACGTKCTIANGTGTCESGSCKVATCNAGYGDCDGDPTNGCEQSLTTNVHCGACNTACTVVNGVGSCTTGTCTVGSCNAGYGDCDKAFANGCEVNLNTNSAHCSACNAACPSTSGTPACVAGVCKFSTCSAGLGDCDGTGSCSTVIKDDVNNCGACGRTCSVANGAPKCTGTACGILSCNAGFADCNASYIDGCEQSLRTADNCGACGVTCSYTNAAGNCSTGACQLGACSTGWANCDGIASNGCEKPVSADINNCGACGKVCSTTNGTAGCSGGACVVTSCNAGYLNCDGNPADCERTVGGTSNSCASAQQVLDATLSPNICGTKAPEVVNVTTSTTKFFKVHLVRCDGGPCKDAEMMRAKFTLTNPTGVVYELRVYNDSGCSSLIGAGTSGTPGGTETVIWVDTSWSSTSCYESKDLWVQVTYKSGASCTPATLSITGGYL